VLSEVKERGTGKNLLEQNTGGKAVGDPGAGNRVIEFGPVILKVEARVSERRAQFLTSPSKISVIAHFEHGRQIGRNTLYDQIVSRRGI
jgi:hypothetical protein